MLLQIQLILMNLISIKEFMEKLKQYKYVILTALIILIIAGIGYFGIKQYQKYQAEKINKEKIAQEAQQQKDSEVEKLKQEVKALQNKKPEIIIKEVPATKSETDNSSIIQLWRPRVTYIDCKIVLNGKTIAEQSGSGYVFGRTDTGGVMILTNKHMIIMTVSGRSLFPTSCEIKIPGNTQSMTVLPGDQILGKFDAVQTDDWTMITIKNPTSYLQTILKTFQWDNDCKNTAELGEKILVLGYPGIGDKNDITATDGIISGYDGNYYITSAKIEHGNSGGVAISVKNNCFLGIPSFADVGSVESLARILKFSAIPIFQ